MKKNDTTKRAQGVQKEQGVRKEQGVQDIAVSAGCCSECINQLNCRKQEQRPSGVM